MRGSLWRRDFEIELDYSYFEKYEDEMLWCTCSWCGGYDDDEEERALILERERARFLECTAEWSAIRFEPGGVVMSHGRSIRLRSATGE